ncbi:GNAT family N-acetyltransferase [Bacillus sp. AFS015802]|uniref:GNAT family N-acetyltransferase n=1 Tax=Bacillus sp. AFS015802 TaxID=2033486 RepID=UPI000BF98FAA|nr:GNAT family N-acetyltransferase [Bacillus sp. AFS015802]PFA67109.1 GNAT family N-acetyltransferase [Bacillus sp. AFS015802]
MTVTETKRLNIRWLEVTDAEFIKRLLNEPGWLKYIGDKGIRTIDDAKAYIINGPRAMYEREGFGLFLVERKDDHIPIGLCGLIKRHGLKDVDIGFAFLSDYQSQGYASEAAWATMKFAKDIGIKRLVAITTKDNESSSRLLEKLDLKLEGYVTLPNDTEELKLYGMKL